MRWTICASSAAAVAALWTSSVLAGSSPGRHDPAAADPCRLPLVSGPEDPRDSAWSTTFGVPGLTGAVNCMTSFGDALAVGGRFDYAGATAARGVALWDANGWRAAGNSDFGESYDVRALTVFRNRLVAAGSAFGARQVRGAFVQAWDGVTWTPLATPDAADIDSGILCAAVYHGDLIVAGRFAALGGVPCQNIARWDGTAWHPLGDGTGGNSGTVSSLVVYGDELVAGGDFVRAGGQFASRVARWNGAEWRPVGYGVLGTVECVGLYQGDLIAGGWFDYAEGKPMRRIARWDGTQWGPLGTGIDDTSNASPVYAVEEMNGVLVVGGIFEQAGGVESSNIAFWNGTSWSAPRRGIEPGAGFSYVRAVHTHAGQVYVAGWFTFAGGERAVNVARLGSGGSFQGLGGGQGINGSVAALTSGPDGSVIAGGWFNWAGTTRALGVARWDGAGWTAYGAGFDRPVAAVLQTPEALIAGGDFLVSGDVVVRRVAIWKGSVWEPMGVGFDAPVQALVLYKGDVVAGGDFQTSGSTPLPGVARWDGTAWQPLGAEFPGATGVFVRALTVHGGDLYAAGWLYKEDGESREFVAHWDGARWTVVDAPRATAVLCMMFRGDDLIVGVAASQIPEPMDLVWTWDGKQWNPVGNLLDGWVTSLAMRDGIVYAGTADYAQGEGNVWAWSGSSEWTSLASRFRGGVRALFPTGDGMYAGGGFSRVGTRPAGSIAFWSARTVPAAIADLRAVVVESGIRLEWSCRLDRAEGESVRVERAGADVGPFAAVSGWLEPASSMTFSDPQLQPGRWYWYRILVRDGAGVESASAAVAVQYEPARGASVWLSKPRPAVDGHGVALRYSAGSRPGPVTLRIYDVRGRAVRTLVRDRVTPGVHDAVWDGVSDGGSKVGRGIYFARLDAAGIVCTVRVPVATW